MTEAGVKNFIKLILNLLMIPGSLPDLFNDVAKKTSDIDIYKALCNAKMSIRFYPSSLM